MNVININKGLDIPIKGAPNDIIEDMSNSITIKLHPSKISGIKPKLTCKIDDEVKIGTELFHDKNDPTISFVSNCSGKIKNIVLGERRALDEIKIENDNLNNHHKEFKSFTSSEINSIDKDSLVNILKESGNWTYIRQRPFSKIADSKKSPKSVFVSCFNSAPHALNTNLLINDNAKNALQTGINALCKISGLNYINLSIGSSQDVNFFKSLYNVSLSIFNGPHPAGNVGVQIHKINPINVGESVWYLDFQDLLSIGDFLNSGKIINTKIVSISGEQLVNPTHCKIVKGTVIKNIIKDDLDLNKSRIVSGNILTGSISNIERGIEYYDSQICVVPNNGERHFLGWLMPGFDKYTNSNTYLSKIFKNKTWSLNTLINGSYRTIIPFGYWEDVLPLDVIPQYLVKSILAEDIEEMENLGIYECHEEDFALCSFVCQSKFPVQEVIKKGLMLMEKEA